MEEEGEGRGSKGGEREKRHSLGLQNLHPVEHLLLACMCYFLVNNCHLSPANNFYSDIYTSYNNVKMTIGYSTPVLSALNSFQARGCNSAVNSALRSKAATAG